MNGLDDVPPELDQRVAHNLSQRGIELTPDQAHELGREALSMVRADMRRRGHELPHSDVELLEMLRIARANKNSGN